MSDHETSSTATDNWLSGTEVDTASVSTEDLSSTAQLPCEFITGKAGTGKTYTIRQRILNARPGSILLTAMTGIAAVNLGDDVTTLHSALRFGSFESLQEAFMKGRLARVLANHYIQGVRELVVDECSMMEKRMLDMIWQAAVDAAGYKNSGPIRITLVGDFAQLPPVPDRGDLNSGDYAFNAMCWGESFARYTTKLEKNWRQSDPNFLSALNSARQGDGLACLQWLQRCPVTWAHTLDPNFAGTSLEATNDAVNRVNFARLTTLPGEAFTLASQRWNSIIDTWTGRPKPPSEWEHIPERESYKWNAYVMLLVNDFEAGYVNGDTGYLVGWETVEGGVNGDVNRKPGYFLVQLVRTGQVVKVAAFERLTEKKDPPPEWEKRPQKEWPKFDSGDPAHPWGTPWYNLTRGKWVHAAILRYPMRLAYASTIHKSQGLSLDTLQLNLNSGFLKSPAMVYVALSRCRTPQGLRIVGRPETLAAKCNVDPRVKEWL